MRGTGSEETGEGVRDASAADTDAAEEVEAAGPFRIYLGAAPGVGKTYAMLSEGQRRRRRGADVVAGFVEAYGRRLTEELIDGLEVIPRKAVDYRGRRLEEMDLDAIVRRRPEVALVDELAHTNVPGSGRHGKRWQDVLDILGAGSGGIGAPCQDCSWWVSPILPPHPACGSHRTGRSMCLNRWISRMARLMVRGTGWGSASRGSGSGLPPRSPRR